MSYTRAEMQKAMDDWLESVVWVDPPQLEGVEKRAAQTPETPVADVAKTILGDLMS